MTILQEARCKCGRKFKYPKSGYRPTTCESEGCVKEKLHPYLRVK